MILRAIFVLIGAVLFGGALTLMTVLLEEPPFLVSAAIGMFSVLGMAAGVLFIIEAIWDFPFEGPGN